jgi:hypothetical protein
VARHVAPALAEVQEQTPHPVHRPGDAVGDDDAQSEDRQAEHHHREEHQPADPRRLARHFPALLGDLGLLATYAASMARDCRSSCA